MKKTCKKCIALTKENTRLNKIIDKLIVAKPKEVEEKIEGARPVEQEETAGTKGIRYGE